MIPQDRKDGDTIRRNRWSSRQLRIPIHEMYDGDDENGVCRNCGRRDVEDYTNKYVTFGMCLVFLSIFPIIIIIIYYYHPDWRPVP